LRFYIIIPVHNEEAYLRNTLNSIINQTHLPSNLIIVNDHSTDGTQEIIDEFTSIHSFIHSVSTESSIKHEPGSKVINAFNKGLSLLDSNYDIICKFDGDLIFPENYLEKISEKFKLSEKYGMVGGFCYIEKEGAWQIERLTGKDHIRGALKAYRKACFEQIGKLKPSMGWDTVDELLAQYHGWDVCTIESLHVKHLKPTGTSYSKKAGKLQGEAFKKMRYGFCITMIAAAKLAIKKKSFSYFLDCIVGFLKSKNDFLVSVEEGKFIRKLRWRNIRNKIF